MAALAFVLPILPGKHEAWRRFYQELRDLRPDAYEESRRHLGICKELAWVTQTSWGEVALVYIEAADPRDVVAKLATSDLPFDRWFRQQVLDLQGVDLRLPRAASVNELVFEWQLS
jgi:hypothetical protein